MTETRCSANRSTARENGSPGGVYSTGQVRDLAWTRPCEPFSRLSLASRRSQGSLPQHVSGIDPRVWCRASALPRGQSLRQLLRWRAVGAFHNQLPARCPDVPAAALAHRDGHVVVGEDAGEAIHGLI